MVSGKLREMLETCTKTLMCKQQRHACLRCSCLKHACLDLLCKRAFRHAVDEFRTPDPPHAMLKLFQMYYRGEKGVD